MAEGKGLSRGWRIVLVASLALNIAVVAMVAGLALRIGRDGPPPRFEMALGPVGEALSPQDRRAIARALRRDPALRGGALRPDGGGARALVEALRQEPVEAEALRAALAASADRIERLRQAGQTALVNRLMSLPADDRAALADRIEAALERPARR